MLVIFMKLEEILQKVKSNEIINDSIGTKQEKNIHKVLKYYLCEDANNHEIKVDNYYVDVLKDDMIYEIQTRSFNLIKDKINALLKFHNVTIVYPMTIEKMIYILDEKNEIIRKRKSPKSASPLTICSELYKIKHLLSHPNLHLMIILLKTNETRYLRMNRYHRLVSSRIDEVPLEISSSLTFNQISELVLLLPDNLPNEFTTTDLKKSLKVSQKEAVLIANILYSLKGIDRIGKRGNSYIYKKV